MMTLWPACRFAGGGLFVVLALRRDKRRALNYFSAGQGESCMSRADLVDVYISGLNLAEAVRQMFGEGGGRQVANPNNALVTGIGVIPYARNWGTSAAMILEA